MGKVTDASSSAQRAPVRVAWEHAGEPEGDDGGAPLAAELPVAADWAPWAGPHPLELLALQLAIMGGGEGPLPGLHPWPLSGGA